MVGCCGNTDRHALYRVERLETPWHQRQGRTPHANDPHERLQCTPSKGLTRRCPRFRLEWYPSNLFDGAHHEEHAYVLYPSLDVAAKPNGSIYRTSTPWPADSEQSIAQRRPRQPWNPPATAIRPHAPSAGMDSSRRSTRSDDHGTQPRRAGCSIVGHRGPPRASQAHLGGRMPVHGGIVRS